MVLNTGWSLCGVTVLSMLLLALNGELESDRSLFDFDMLLISPPPLSDTFADHTLPALAFSSAAEIVSFENLLSPYFL